MCVLDTAREIAKNGVKGEYVAFHEYVRQRMKESTPEKRKLWAEVLELYERQYSRRVSQSSTRQEKIKAAN